MRRKGFLTFATAGLVTLVRVNVKTGAEGSALRAMVRELSGDRVELTQ